MKRTCLFLYGFLVLVCGFFVGCQATPAAADANDLDGGLKLSDLRDTSADLRQADFLIKFRVFEYTIEPNSLDQLNPVYAQYSQKDLHYRDAEAFRANGLAAALIPHQDGSQFVRTLNKAGAVRGKQAILEIPPASTEILSSVSINQPQQISFASVQGKPVSDFLYPGYVGWTLMAESSVIRDTILLKATPAYWLTGAEDLRLRLGKQPIDFKLFEFAGFDVRLREGDILLIAPTHLSKDVSVNQALFKQFGKKEQARFFVLICESAGL